MSLDKIAKHAGVSIATVSRVLNRNPRVRPRTAQLVWKTIRELKYTVPMHESAPEVDLPSGRTGTVAMVFLGGGTVSSLMPVFMNVVSGIEEQLRELGLRMLFCEVSEATDLKRHLHYRDIDGAVVLSHGRMSGDVEQVRRIAELVPVVRVMGVNAGPAVVDHVVPHNWAIGEMAFDYLQQQRCPRVSYMFLPVFESNSHVAGIHGIRAASFAMAARAAGLDVDFYWIGEDESAAKMLGAKARTARTPDELVDIYLSRAPRGAGLFLSTDQELARLYPLLLARGVRPGEDIIPVGCDNEGPTLAPLHPRPATIDIQPREIGRQAVLRLLRRIGHPGEPPLLIEVSPKLVPGFLAEQHGIGLRGVALSPVGSNGNGAMTG